MTTSPTDSDSRQITEALSYGIAGDDARAMELLQPIVDRGRRATYALLATLAEAASMDARRQQPGMHFGITVEHTITGAAGSADDLPPAIRFAARFVTAWANRDQDTTLALYEAVAGHAEEHGTSHLVDGIGAVYDMAVVSLRGVLERERRGGAS